MVPSPSRQEDQMVEFLTAHVQKGGKRLRGTCTRDGWNNVFIRKGDAEFYPCIAAHLDTVPGCCPAQVVQQDGTLVGLDAKGQRTGIGADDKAGVLVCLELLERIENIKVVLFGAEEHGSVGARNAAPNFFDDVGC